MLTTVFLPIILTVVAALFPGYTYTQNAGDICWVTRQGVTEVHASNDDAWCEYTVEAGETFTVAVLDANGQMVSRTFTADAEPQEYNVLN